MIDSGTAAAICLHREEKILFVCRVAARFGQFLYSVAVFGKSGNVIWSGQGPA
jgi:hypothetical protein